MRKALEIKCRSEGWPHYKAYEPKWGCAKKIAFQGKLYHFSGKSAHLHATLERLYSNAESIGVKQKELGGCEQLKGYDCIGITEAWYGSLHDWGTAVDG